VTLRTPTAARSDSVAHGLARLAWVAAHRRSAAARADAARDYPERRRGSIARPVQIACSFLDRASNAFADPPPRVAVSRIEARRVGIDQPVPGRLGRRPRRVARLVQVPPL
jgi:hypothetical protein